MGISMLWLAPGPASGCEPVSPLELDPGSPGPPPLQGFPLPATPKGPVQKVTTTYAGSYQFGAGRVEIKRGTRFTWRFLGPDPHNVTLANGPVGFSSPTIVKGSFSYRFMKAGTYRLVCSLHPVAMTEVLVVR
jgi:plastocyanin